MKQDDGASHAEFRFTLALVLLIMAIKHKAAFLVNEIRTSLIRGLQVKASADMCIKVQEIVEKHFPESARLDSEESFNRLH